jgi:hypothetical protein
MVQAPGVRGSVPVPAEGFEPMILGLWVERAVACTIKLFMAVILAVL